MSCGAPSSRGTTNGSNKAPLVQQQREIALRNAQLRKEMRMLQEATRGHLAAAALGQDALEQDDPLEVLLQQECVLRQQLQRERATQVELHREEELLRHEIASIGEQIQAERLVRSALLSVLTQQRNACGDGGGSSAVRDELGPLLRRKADAKDRLEQARRDAQKALERHSNLLKELHDVQFVANAR